MNWLILLFATAELCAVAFMVFGTSVYQKVIGFLLLCICTIMQEIILFGINDKTDRK